MLLGDRHLHLREISHLKVWYEFSSSRSKLSRHYCKQLARRLGHSVSRFNEWEQMHKIALAGNSDVRLV